jgi:putative ABC transport system permease protein
MARKYFGDEQALGKSMIFADTMSIVVTGVLKNIPSQSHMQFDMLVSFDTYKRVNPYFSYDGGWGNINVRNYILLRHGVDQQALFKKARNVYVDYVEEEMKRWGMMMYLGFEPLHEIYLHTKRGNGMGPVGSIQRLYIVSGIAVFVILLACINFINLSTARAADRAKEVGFRKVVGSTRFALVSQFLSESFMITALSFLLALALIGSFLPIFNQLLGKTYQLTVLLDPIVLIGVVFLIVIITLLSGYYPALVLSSMRPSTVLKGSLKSTQKGVQIRRGLVVFQFFISAALIICTFVVIDQLSYMQNRDLGFSGKQVIVVETDKVTDRGEGAKQRYAGFWNEIGTFSNVESVSFTNAVPGRPGWVGQWAHAEDKSSDETIGVEYMAVDEHYLGTLGLTLLAGRNFDQSIPSELDEGLIINETAVQKFGWETPENAIGRRIESPSQRPAGTVIGVVKDYHEFGLQENIYPMTMDYNPAQGRYFAIRFRTTGTADLVANLEMAWKKYYDGYDFNYFFLDENFARQYQSEQRLAKVFTLFSVVTILIAIIGLVGLVSFMVVSRTKEIGVRKVLGADAFSITALLSREFVWLVLIANLLACPVAWYLANDWLGDFAFKTEIRPDIFLITVAIGLIITLLAVSLQTLKAALSDPVKALRYE